MSSLNMKITRLVSGISWVLSLSMSVSPAQADGTAALKMAPRGANAVMTIDVAKLIAPMRGQLRSEMTQKYGVEF